MLEPILGQKIKEIRNNKTSQKSEQGLKTNHSNRQRNRGGEKVMTK
jgi:hypothetical protein